MSRVEEIQAQIESLPFEDMRRIAEWVRERDQQLWDGQIDRDFAAGKLDFLLREADEDDLQEWPPTE
ncbi:MAG: hypothetical protein FJW38_23580 [Acidobacteria bacterium]|nr:hypothetical protein [Acidobacteriota bacterium]